jgi:hypothetical protein
MLRGNHSLHGIIRLSLLYISGTTDPVLTQRLGRCFTLRSEGAVLQPVLIRHSCSHEADRHIAFGREIKRGSEYVEGEGDSLLHAACRQEGGATVPLSVTSLSAGPWSEHRQ